ncbi:hypothetical protein HPB47_022703, partial [Ixodes persulcatus]
MEMSKPVPNFISVQGHLVMVGYRSLRRVCSRCGKEVHTGPVCKTPHSDRHAHATPKLPSGKHTPLPRSRPRTLGPARRRQPPTPRCPSPPGNPRMAGMTRTRLPHRTSPLHLCDPAPVASSNKTVPDAPEDSESCTLLSTAVVFGCP